MKRSLFVFAIALLMFSCNNRDVYIQYLPVEKGNWHKDSICKFDIEVSDTTVAYNLYVNMRNRSEYPYQNIWLFVDMLSPDSILKRDTIEFYLSDSHGKWLGTGVGAAYEMPVLYRQNLRFELSGNYHFGISHGMRDTILPGINDVGMRLEKVSNP